MVLKFKIESLVVENRILSIKINSKNHIKNFFFLSFLVFYFTMRLFDFITKF